MKVFIYFLFAILLIGCTEKNADVVLNRYLLSVETEKQLVQGTEISVSEVKNILNGIFGTSVRASRMNDAEITTEKSLTGDGSVIIVNMPDDKG